MQKKPNILMIFSDHLRADALGCFGSTVGATPNIDLLAEEGVAFRHCMATQPTCTPARASVLTGRLPSVLRTRMVGCSMPESEKTLPAILRENGYHTASIGKIHLRPQREEWNRVDSLGEGETYYGFEHVDLVDGHADGCMGSGYREWLAKTTQVQEMRDVETEFCEDVRNTKKSKVPYEGWSSVYIVQKVQEFLEQAAEEPRQPFFLHVSFPDPHPDRLSFTVPAPYDHMYDHAQIPSPLPPFSKESGMSEMYEMVRKGLFGPMDYPIGTNAADWTQYTQADWHRVRSRYFGLVKLLDESVGQMMKVLADQGLKDNTIVVFLSDHGDYLGDYGLHGKGFHFDSTLRVPLIWSGVDIAKGENLQVASTIDILPTLLELVGCEEPTGVQGVSYAKYLKGRGDYTRTSALSENDDDFARFRIRTLTTDRWMLNYYAKTEYVELFDLKNDPGEQRNLAASPEGEEITAILREKMMMALAENQCLKPVVNQLHMEPIPKIVKYCC